MAAWQASSGTGGCCTLGQRLPVPGQRHLPTLEQGHLQTMVLTLQSRAEAGNGSIPALHCTALHCTALHCMLCDDATAPAGFTSADAPTADATVAAPPPHRVQLPCRSSSTPAPSMTGRRGPPPSSAWPSCSTCCATGSGRPRLSSGHSRRRSTCRSPPCGWQSCAHARQLLLEGGQDNPSGRACSSD